MGHFFSFLFQSPHQSKETEFVYPTIKEDDTIGMFVDFESNKFTYKTNSDNTLLIESKNGTEQEPAV